MKRKLILTARQCRSKQKNKSRKLIFKEVSRYFGYFSHRRRFAFEPKYWASGLNTVKPVLSGHPRGML